MNLGMNELNLICASKRIETNKRKDPRTLNVRTLKVRTLNKHKRENKSVTRWITRGVIFVKNMNNNSNRHII